MKYSGKALRAQLDAQGTAVTMVYGDGREVHNVSCAYAASKMADGEFVGHGKNGVVTVLIAKDAPRRAFALRNDLASAAAVRRLPKVHRNPQSRGAKEWNPQPTFANTGHAGRVSTVHLGGMAR